MNLVLRVSAVQYISSSCASTLRTYSLCLLYAKLSAAPATPMPACSPNLMPFHIQYSSPAPVSTHFRVKPDSAPNGGLDDPKDTSQKNVTDAQPSVEETNTADQATLVSEPSTSAGGSSSATLAAGAGLQDGGEAGDEKQFVAAFQRRVFP